MAQSHICTLSKAWLEFSSPSKGYFWMVALNIKEEEIIKYMDSNGITYI